MEKIYSARTRGRRNRLLLDKIEQKKPNKIMSYYNWT